LNKLERIDLFDLKSGFFFFASLLVVASLSLLYEYLQYRDFHRFDDPLVRAHVVSQEFRLINDTPKMALKLELETGATARVALRSDLMELRGRDILIELWVKNLTFWEYLKGFNVYRASIYEVYEGESLKESWYKTIALAHDDFTMQELYGALFVATPMSHDFQVLVGAMGLSHILSISGYHFGILSMIAYFLLRPPYRWFHNRYFPARHGNRDLFLVILALLFGYLWALEFIPPMVRSFGMIVVGYWLYDRGVKIFSFQTLFVTLGLLLAFFPTLFFSLGFWFSSFGVLSIFIFVRYYEHWKAWQIFLALHIWCYLVMLPISIAIFGTFGWWHIGSIILALLFNLYYPAVLALHFTPWGDVFDPYLLTLFQWGDVNGVVVPMWMGYMSVVLAFLAMKWKWAFWSLGVLGLVTLGACVYQIA
jgi:competence protein ComEC